MRNVHYRFPSVAVARRLLKLSISLQHKRTSALREKQGIEWKRLSNDCRETKAIAWSPSTVIWKLLQYHGTKSCLYSNLLNTRNYKQWTGDKFNILLCKPQFLQLAFHIISTPPDQQSCHDSNKLGLNVDSFASSTPAKGNRDCEPQKILLQFKNMTKEYRHLSKWQSNLIFFCFNGSKPS